MNYNEYINSLQPGEELKDKIRNSVEHEIAEQNRIRIRRRNVILSSAACFVLLAVSVVSIRALNNSTPPVTGKTETSLGDKTTTKRTVPETTIVSNKITINTNNNGQKSMPQRIIVNGYGYFQVCDNSKKDHWGDDNGNIVIEESDIGDMICLLKADNLVDEDALEDMATMSDSQAENNRFYNAKVYKYSKCKNGTVLIVKTSDDYYMFTFSDFLESVGIDEVLNLYNANGNNTLKEIEIIKCDEESSFNDKNLRTITNQKDINKIIELLSKENTAANGDETISKYSDDISNGAPYKIVATYTDNSELSILIYPHFINLEIGVPNDYNYYEISDEEYNGILSAIGEKE